ncbi:hypothetical protein ES703_115540 [subsurface metagenome]
MGLLEDIEDFVEGYFDWLYDKIKDCFSAISNHITNEVNKLTDSINFIYIKLEKQISKGFKEVESSLKTITEFVEKTIDAVSLE